MNKLLVVVDYQNDFVVGSLGSEFSKQIDGAIAEKVEAYRAEGADIIYTMDTHGPAYPEMQEGKKQPVIHCQNGTEGWRLYGKTAEVCKDAMTIGKHTFGSFDLAMMALNRGYDQIELCGVYLDVGVLANAVLLKTAQPEAEIVIDPNCVAGTTKKLTEETLDIMENLQMTVLRQ